MGAESSEGKGKNHWRTVGSALVAGLSVPAAIYLLGLGDEVYDLFFETPEEALTKANLDKIETEFIRLGYTGNLDLDGLNSEGKNQLFASGGIDVFGEQGTRRLEIVWNSDGSIDELKVVEKSPALGTGFFIIEDADDGADSRWDLMNPIADRPAGAIQDYEVTREYLEKRGALSYSELTEVDKKKYDGVLRGIVSRDIGNDPLTAAPRSGIVRYGDSPILDEIIKTGGFTDTTNTTWKVLVDPKHGPFLVIDRDGDSSVPRMEGKVEGVRQWVDAQGVILNPRGK